MSIQEYWAVYFGYLTDKTKRQKINEILEKEEGIAMASKVLLNISRDEKERARLMSEYKYELDAQSKLVYAERKGLKEGLEKGRQEGRLEGRTSERQDIARKMKDMGLSAAQIALATGIKQVSSEQ